MHLPAKASSTKTAGKFILTPVHPSLCYLCNSGCQERKSLLQYFNPFSPSRHFLMPLQQMTFENTVAKGKIVQNKQFLLSPQCFQLYSITILSVSYIEIFSYFANILSRSSAAELLYVGKG